ncbi:bifunctional DNA primase/polymerase [Actinophytocola sp. KF-1]
MSTQHSNTSHTTDLLAAALAATARGWHVFPLRAGSKEPAIHGEAQCPRTGDCRDGHRTPEQRATVALSAQDQAAWTVRRWNTAVATGPSGLLVIDLDVPKPDDKPRPDVWNLPGVHDGLDVFVAVCEQARQPVPWDTFTVRTPSGGTHLYFRAPHGVRLRNTSGDRGRGLGWKVDTRAWGGHVVAPGCVVDGHRYEITNDRDPAPLPPWLCERLAPPPLPTAPARPVTVGRDRRARYLESAIRAEAGKVANAASGERNHTLYTAAFALGQLVAGGELAAADVEAALLTAAGRHIAAGAFTERKARQTIRSGIRNGAVRPRRVAA